MGAVHCYKNLALVITITRYWLHSEYFWNVIRRLVAWLSSGRSSSEIPTSSSPLLPATWAPSHTEATRKGNSKALSTYGGPVATLGVFLFLLRKVRHSVSLLLVPQCFRGGKCLSCVAQLPRARAGCKHGRSDSQPMLSPPHCTAPSSGDIAEKGCAGL